MKKSYDFESLWICKRNGKSKKWVKVTELKRDNFSYPYFWSPVPQITFLTGMQRNSSTLLFNCFRGNFLKKNRLFLKKIWYASLYYHKILVSLKISYLSKTSTLARQKIDVSFQIFKLKFIRNIVCCKRLRISSCKLQFQNEFSDFSSKIHCFFTKRQSEDKYFGIL